MVQVESNDSFIFFEFMVDNCPLVFVETKVVADYVLGLLFFLKDIKAMITHF